MRSATWPRCGRPRRLAAAIDRAHQLGCRVTAHVFGEQALAELVDAGIDGIEHGTGLSDATIEQMAERQVALVPTMVQLENFDSYAAAGEARFPAYAAAHPRPVRHPARAVRRGARGRRADLCRHRRGRLPAARTGRAGDGCAAAFSSPEYALGAGSWRARAWLGRPENLVEGVPADLVVFDADPRGT